MFDFWNVRWFYLDGTKLLYFKTEEDSVPRAVIKLDGCIVDGVWPKGDTFTFTIRSLTNDDLFYYLGAFSENEA